MAGRIRLRAWRRATLPAWCGQWLAVLSLFACGAPPDRGLTRPAAVPATRFEQRDLHLDGVRLRYIDVGPEQPAGGTLPVVLIHGHTSRIEEYDELVARLAPRHRALVFDLPGSGYSDKPERDYDLCFAR